jgi:hypothetical protein
MKVQATIGVLAALAAASTGSANAAARSDVDVTTASKPATMSPAALDQLSDELTVTDGKVRVAMPKIKDGPIWAQFHQSKK